MIRTLIPILLALPFWGVSPIRAEYGFEPIRRLNQTVPGQRGHARLAAADGVVLFVQNDSTATLVARSFDDGATWGEPLRLPGGNHEEIRPCLAMVPGGRAVLAYEGSRDSQTTLLIRNSDDHGATWTEPIEIAGPPSFVGFFCDTYSPFRLSTDGAGTWILAARRGEIAGGTCELLLSRSMDDGMTWTRPAPPRDTEGMDIALERPVGIAANDARWLMVARDEITGEGIAFRSIDGAAWERAGVIGPGASDYELRVVASPGVWIAAGFTMTDGSDGSPIYTSHDDGTTWSPSRIIPVPAFASLELESDGRGNAILAWSDLERIYHGGSGANSLPSVFTDITVATASVSTDAGANWSEPFPLNPDATTEPPCPTCEPDLRNDDDIPQATFLREGALIAYWGDVQRFFRTMTRTSDLHATSEFQVAFGETSPNYMFWFASTSGEATADGTTRGLCLTTPATGESAGIWSGPGKWIRTVDRTLIRTRCEFASDQRDVDSIPLWNLGYDNAVNVLEGYPTQPGGPLSGQCLFVDQAGGASGIGRPQGRSEFEAWIAPLPFLTPQWRGEIEGIDGAFTPANDLWNDIHLTFRVMDFDSGGYGAQYDSGSVCLKRLRVDRYDYASLAIEPLWSPPIAEETHAPQTWAQMLEPGLAWIEAGEARYAIPPEPFPPTGATGLHARKTLLPYDPLQPDWNARLFPVAWESDTLYMGELDIRAVGTDSVPDVIAMHFDVPTSEQIVSHVCIRDEPTSPLPSEVAGGPQTYVGFFYSHNSTVIDPAVMPNASRVRMLGDFMTTYDIGPPLAPAADFAVSRMAISRVVPPTRD